MSRYNTTGSRLFTNNTDTEIPSWMKAIHSPVEDSPKEKLNVKFEKVAAFTDAPKVSRDDRDYNSREIEHSMNDTQFSIAAKIELAKFLGGKHYRITEKTAGNTIEFETKITNVPAVFSFRFFNHKGKAKHANVFSIRLENGTGEYPFSHAGLNECLEDLKRGTVKTADLAPAYQAYTITLEEIMRRFNGDQRAAMDRIHELVNKKEIIGVESNTFASVNSMDSMFPQLQKEGDADLPAFEFVKNKEHVAANPHSSGTVLMVHASKFLHRFFDDFKILSSDRIDNELFVKANVMLNGISDTVDFKFGIQKDKLDSIKYCEANQERMTLEQLLKKAKKTNLLEEYEKSDDIPVKRIYKGSILTGREIHKKLMKVASRNVIDQVIENWKERRLIQQVASNTFVTEKSFPTLLNSVNTELLSKEEQQNLKDYMKRITADINRIDVEDTGVRNEYELEASRSIRLANLYNQLSNTFEKFEIKEVNDDCTSAVIHDFSEGAMMPIRIHAEYDQNKCKKLVAKMTKEYSDALKAYKKHHKKLHFAKAVFSEQHLNEIIPTIFKEKDAVIHEIKHTAKNVGNGFYALEVPLSDLIQKLSSKYMMLTDEEQKDYLEARAYFGKKIEACYTQDTGVRNDYELEFSNSIRLANLYNVLSRQMNDFSLSNISNDSSSATLTRTGAYGNDVFHVTAEYDGNTPVQLNLEHEKDASKNEIVDCYCQEYGKNQKFAKAVFSKNSIKNILKRMVEADYLDASVDMILKKAKSLGSGLYASDEPLVYLLNSNSIPVKKAYEKAKRLNEFIDRLNVEDTGTRDRIDENEIQLINDASAYLAKQFADFKLNHASLKGNTLEYEATLFDADSGLSNIICFTFDVEDHHLKNCKLSVNGKDLTFDKVKEAFATNSILKKYLQYSAGKKEHAPVVFFIQRLADKLNKLTKASKDEIKDTIISWYKAGKIQRIGTNAFASKYTIEQLLSLSNIKALTDEEIKEKLQKCIRTKLLKVSKNHRKDTGSREIDTSWNINHFIRFARNELKQIYEDAHIVDANLTDDTFTIQAKTDVNGIRKNHTFTWNIENGFPVRVSMQKEDEDPTIAKFASIHKTKAGKILFSQKQLEYGLFGYVDVHRIPSICNTLQKEGFIQKVANNYVSDYSMAELLKHLQELGYVDTDIALKQVKQANRSEEIDTSIYQLDDQSRALTHERKLFGNDLRIRQKLVESIQQAEHGKIITTNKMNHLLERLNTAVSKSDLDAVYKEFRKYLK